MEQALPLLAIDLDRPEPLAQQIADGIRVLLVRGELQPGDTLPSSRRLARDLAVHFNTVAAAYRTLESEGWLELRRKHGTVVLPREAPPGREHTLEALAAELSEELARLLARYESQGLTGRSLVGVLKEEIARREQ